MVASRSPVWLYAASAMKPASTSPDRTVRAWLRSLRAGRAGTTTAPAGGIAPASNGTGMLVAAAGGPTDSAAGAANGSDGGGVVPLDGVGDSRGSELVALTIRPAAGRRR
jgi:hypothetical protein